MITASRLVISGADRKIDLATRVLDSATGIHSFSPRYDSCFSRQLKRARQCLKGTSLLTNELTRNSSGNARPRSFLLSDPLWIGLNSYIGEREVNSTLGKDGGGEGVTSTDGK